MLRSTVPSCQSPSSVCNVDMIMDEEECNHHHQHYHQKNNNHIVEVLAPMTLSEGYKLWVQIGGNGNSFPVVVPPGGVKSGQTFLVSLPPNPNSPSLNGSSNTTTRCNSRVNTGSSMSILPSSSEDSSFSPWHCDNTNNNNIIANNNNNNNNNNTSSSRKEEIRKNTGKWKDGLFACFKHGLCHPHIWNAWLCPQILLNQILIRMELKPLGSSLWPTSITMNSSSSSNNTSTTTTTTTTANTSTMKKKDNSMTRKLFWLLIIITAYIDVWIAPPMIDLSTFDNNNEQQQYYVGASSSTTTGTRIGSSSYNNITTNTTNTNNIFLYHQLIYILMTLPMTIYGIIVVVKLRGAIRAKYNIPTGKFGKLEDFMIALFCNCCMLSQMARQTADYDNTEPASCCTPNGIMIIKKQQQQQPNNTTTNTTTTDNNSINNNSTTATTTPETNAGGLSSSSCCGNIVMSTINAATVIPMV